MLFDTLCGGVVVLIVEYVVCRAARQKNIDFHQVMAKKT